jgi:hypothetical protein
MHSLALLPAPADYLTFVVIIFFLVFVWVLVLLMLSQVPGGWGSFAKRYPAQTRPAGTTFSISSYGSGKLWGRGKGVRVIIADTGIYFYMVFCCRAGHKPFLLPWESVKRIEKGHGLFGNFYIVEVEDTIRKFWVQLPGKSEHDLSRYYKAGISIPTEEN